jgi:uncharacterized protein YndB with AHSA1/START domain
MKTSKATTFTIVREFNAPIEDVFNAFAEAGALNEWWGPSETNNSTILLDFRPGGIFHYKMEKDGNVNYGRFLFSRIEPHHTLEFTNSFADENANVIPAPFDISLPKVIFYSLTFSARNAATVLTLTASPVDASATEIEGFSSINESMQQGFEGTFAQLAEYLKQVRKNKL